jgi:hypothetical protein
VSRRMRESKRAGCCRLKTGVRNPPAQCQRREKCHTPFSRTHLPGADVVDDAETPTGGPDGPPAGCLPVQPELPALSGATNQLTNQSPGVHWSGSGCQRAAVVIPRFKTPAMV